MSSLSRVEWRAVGTTCSAAVTVRDGETEPAREALSAAREEVAACERELSRFDPASDLSRLNAAGGEWSPAGPRLREALRLALQAREDTGGRFDPTILPALVSAGYDRSFELLEERPAVDLGGIGKGYAARRALDAMLAAAPGLPGGLVDLGGDIALRGETPEGGPWRIAVADARRPGATLALLALAAGGIATSGRDARRFGPGGSLHHLIDPETGEPALPGPLTVTVVAADAAEAEAHATALAISSLEEAEANVAAHPAISALYVPQYGPAIPLGRLPLAPQLLVVSAA